MSHRPLYPRCQCVDHTQAESACLLTGRRYKALTGMCRSRPQRYPRDIIADLLRDGAIERIHTVPANIIQRFVNNLNRPTAPRPYAWKLFLREREIGRLIASKDVDSIFFKEQHVGGELCAGREIPVLILRLPPMRCPRRSRSCIQFFWHLPPYSSTPRGFYCCIPIRRLSRSDT